MHAVIANMPSKWLAERRHSDAARWDEMWNGVLHMPPMPNRRHQDFARDLLIWLHQCWAQPRGNRVNQEVNLTTPDDEDEWTSNFRIQDLALLTPDRFSIDKGDYMAGAPTVVIEVRSPRDETYEKFPFYAELGVPEVWVFDRDTREPEIYALSNGEYKPLAPGENEWILSPAAGIEFHQESPGSLWVRLANESSSAREIGVS